MISAHSDAVVDRVKQLITQALHLSYPELLTTINSSDFSIELIPPPQVELGDFAFGCFKLSKMLKSNPAQIALTLQEQILKLSFTTERSLTESHSILQSVLASGPYLNLRCHVNFYRDQLLKPILDLSYFMAPVLTNQPKTMIEFSQPNTHKELHVGHMRNACLGDALVKIKRFAGVEVVASTFPGDMGAHVAKCLWYFHYHNTEPVPAQRQGEWLGRLYSLAHLKLENEKGTPLEDQNRQQLTEILQQLENQQGSFFQLWKQTREWSLQLMNQVYDWLDIRFDVWIWESDVDHSSRTYVEELFAQGRLQRSEGAIGYDLSEYKLGFCLLLKTDGTGLYATKDLELAKKKFLEHKIERSVYVVDLRQALHFSQIFKVLELLGFEQAKNCYHLQYNFVELPDGAMSSRKGNIVPIMTLVENMQLMIRERYLARYIEDWSEAEIEQVSHQVAMGAIKYGMLKMDTAKKIVFDLEEWLKIDGESGPFIQYSAARIKSLIRKAQLEPLVPLDFTVQAATFAHISEKGLIQKLLFFKQVVAQTARAEKPHLLTNYLYDLAKAFNYFYHECDILSESDTQLRLSRVALSRATGVLLEQGLKLLGIPTPERM